MKPVEAVRLVGSDAVSVAGRRVLSWLLNCIKIRVLYVHGLVVFSLEGVLPPRSGV